MANRGFGIVGGLDPAIVRTIVPELEQLGYSTFWANSGPSGNGLETLAEAAAVSSTMQLGVGVLPIDKLPPDQVLSMIESLKLPAHRVLLGIGSGQTPGAAGVEVVRNACEALVGKTDAKVLIGALGPRMTKLSGSDADGALLSWLTPAEAVDSAARVREAATSAARPAPLVCSYFRVAMGQEARPKLEAEAARYAGFAAYAAHFKKMGVEAIDTCLYGDDAATLQTRLAAFDASLDEAVVRAIVADETADAYLTLARAAAPA